MNNCKEGLKQSARKESFSKNDVNGRRQRALARQQPPLLPFGKPCSLGRLPWAFLSLHIAFLLKESWTLTTIPIFPDEETYVWSHIYKSYVGKEEGWRAGIHSQLSWISVLGSFCSAQHPCQFRKIVHHAGLVCLVMSISGKPRIYC